MINLIKFIEFIKSKFYVVGTLVVVLGISLATTFPTNNILIIADADSDEILATFTLGLKNEFAVKFRHSVNQSLVEDRYRVLGDKIIVYETLYYNFGAGVQTDLKEGEVLVEAGDGGMLVTGIDSVIEDLIYRPSPVYDHTLIINGEEVSLSQLAYNCDLLRFYVGE